MKRMLAILLIAISLTACYDPDSATPNGPEDGRWSYVKGPHGETCLMFADGMGNMQMIAMDCDTVNP